MTTDIFIKTCQHDADYHAYCLASIDKYCSGFRNTVVVDGEHPKGYLHQQVVKMHADEHCPGADFILVTDSDTLFTHSVTPESFMVDGKPVWVATPWTEEMLAHPGTKAWYDVMGQYFNQVPPFEFMRRQPFVFPAHLTSNLRRDCLSRHGVDIETYVMSKGAFSEWNVLGFYAWLHHHDEFHWIDTSKDALPSLNVIQMWSHSPIEHNLPVIERILA